MEKTIKMCLQPVNTDDYAGPTIVEARVYLLNGTFLINRQRIKTFDTRVAAVAYVQRMSAPVEEKKGMQPVKKRHRRAVN